MAQPAQTQEAELYQGEAVRGDYTPSGAAVVVGQIVLDAGGNMPGVVTQPEGIADGALGSVALGGRGVVFKVKKAVGTGVTFARGARVGWDDSGNTAVAAGTGTADIGIAINAAVTGDNHVKTMLLPGFNVALNVASAIVALTDSSGGTADDTIALIPTLTDSPASADALRDDINTNLYPVLKNNFADLAAKVNALIAALKT